MFGFGRVKKYEEKISELREKNAATASERNFLKEKLEKAEKKVDTLIEDRENYKNKYERVDEKYKALEKDKETFEGKHSFEIKEHLKTHNKNIEDINKLNITIAELNAKVKKFETENKAVLEKDMLEFKNTLLTEDRKTKSELMLALAGRPVIKEDKLSITNSPHFESPRHVSDRSRGHY